jgi:hypothetical protein
MYFTLDLVCIGVGGADRISLKIRILYEIRGLGTHLPRIIFPSEKGFAIQEKSAFRIKEFSRRKGCKFPYIVLSF